MVSVAQRITQYNSEVGQPRGGLIKSSALTQTAIEDEHGMLDHKIENLHASVIGMAVDYLSRLAHVQIARDEFSDSVRKVFRVSLRGADASTPSTQTLASQRRLKKPFPRSSTSTRATTLSWL